MSRGLLHKLHMKIMHSTEEVSQMRRDFSGALPAGSGVLAVDPGLRGIFQFLALRSEAAVGIVVLNTLGILRVHMHPPDRTRSLAGQQEPARRSATSVHTV